MRKTMKSKIFAWLLLAACLLTLLLCACGSAVENAAATPSPSPTPTKDPIQEQLEQSHVPAAPEVDTSHLPRGEILRDEDGTHYVNREFGIACDLDGDWYILSDEELAQVAGLTVDTVAGEDVRDAFASAQIFCEFGALRPSDSASMMLMIEDLDKARGGDVSEEEYREISLAQLQPQADALGASKFSASKNQVMFAGQLRCGIYVTAELNGQKSYSQQIILKQGHYMLTLTLGTYGEAGTSSLIALFHEPDTE